MSFTKLYKKTSTGAIQFWQISVIENSDHSTGYDIWTTYGQIDGKEQETVESIFHGKNVGKKNETSPKQQAMAEAQSRWEKKKKSGYVDSILAAKSDQIDALIEGGILPMLAHKFTDQGHKIVYPCFAQPKLDGIRCIAIVKDGTCTLWSRTRKPINSVPHIAEEVLNLSQGKDLVLDGELYNHHYKNNFEKIVSLVRQEEPDSMHREVQYHIYDLPIADLTFIERLVRLEELNIDACTYCQFVVTRELESESVVMDEFNMFRELGYEGVMLRNFKGKYVNKRSYDLLKVKEFDDAEFAITGIEEGRGKLAGHVGAFVCTAANGKEFLAKMSGETSNLKRYFENHDLWQGKLLTVQYQGLTGSEQVPRFPVGKSIRDYE